MKYTEADNEVRKQKKSEGIDGVNGRKSRQLHLYGRVIFITRSPQKWKDTIYLQVLIDDKGSIYHNLHIYSTLIFITRSIQVKRGNIHHQVSTDKKGNFYH